MTADQMARLKSGEMDWEEMLLATMLVQLKGEAERIGGDCGEALKKVLGKNPSSFEEAMELLNDNDPELSGKCKGQSLQLGMAWASGSAPVLFESSPVWSPDRKGIAFTRSGLHENQDDVWVVDRDSGKERRVFSSANVRNVEWTADGKSLVVASERDLGFQRIDNARGSEKPVTSWPSYSEVWLLTLD